MSSITWKAWEVLLRLALGAALAAGAIYVCGIISRELIASRVVRPVYDEAALIRFLEGHFPDSGTYTVPDPSDDDEAVKELHEIGPIATLHVLDQRDIFLKARSSPIRIGQTFLTALLIGWVLRKARPAINSYRSRVFFVALIGLAAALYNDLADPIWVYHPWPWSLAKAVDHCASWTLAGSLLAIDWFTGTMKILPGKQSSVSGPSAEDPPH